jgi:hypothetical protein
VRGAEQLVQALPRDYVDPGVGPVCELRHYHALAWAISHFGDVHYRAALGAAPSVAPGQRHPLDELTYYLRLYLNKLRADGRAGDYRAHGWLGTESVDLDPGWFVDGNVSFDALGSAIIFADGRRVTGIEARWTGVSSLVKHESNVVGGGEGDADGASDEDDDDSRDLAGPPVTEAVAWMRTEEAKAWLDPRQPRLKKRENIEACRLALDIPREVARQAFMAAVPPDRRRTRGGQQKN